MFDVHVWDNEGERVVCRCTTVFVVAIFERHLRFRPLDERLQEVTVRKIPHLQLTTFVASGDESPPAIVEANACHVCFVSVLARIELAVRFVPKASFRGGRGRGGGGGGGLIFTGEVKMDKNRWH